MEDPINPENVGEEPQQELISNDDALNDFFEEKGVNERSAKRFKRKLFKAIGRDIKCFDLTKTERIDEDMITRYLVDNLVGGGFGSHKTLSSDEVRLVIAELGVYGEFEQEEQEEGSVLEGYPDHFEERFPNYSKMNREIKGKIFEGNFKEKYGHLEH